MTTGKKRGRQVEAEKIRRANRAAAVGRLMLGEFSNWKEFLAADNIDLESLPRRNLKAGYHDVKKRLSNETNLFIRRNFQNLSIEMMDNLYEEIKAHRGFEIPLDEFESKYAKVIPKVLNGIPLHCTLVFSLWGLQFKFPEDFLAKDLLTGISQIRDISIDLDGFEKLSHDDLKAKKENISENIRKIEFNTRCCLLSCFNLLESYLNGMAWQFSRNIVKFNTLSQREQKCILDTGNTNLRDKLLKYPRIIKGIPLWTEHDEPLRTFLNDVKPFRDSLVHPSPFSAPAKFGGYDKLIKFYRTDRVIAIQASKLTVEIIVKINSHIAGNKQVVPKWLTDLLKEMDNYELVED